MLSGMLVNSTGRAIGGILLGPIKCSMEVSKRNLNKNKKVHKIKNKMSKKRKKQKKETKKRNKKIKN